MGRNSIRLKAALSLTCVSSIPGGNISSLKSGQMPSSKMQAFSRIIEQNSEFFSNILSFFCAFFPPQNEKSSSDSGSNVCVGSSSRVQMDTHLSIINMPLSASGVPSWAAVLTIVWHFRKSALSWILVWTFAIPFNFAALFFCRSLSSERGCICCKPTLSTGLFLLYLSGIRSLAMQLHGTMILAAITDASRCGHEQRDQKYDSNLPENLKA